MDLLSASFSIIAFSTSKLILDFTPWFDLFSIEINHVRLFRGDISSTDTRQIFKFCSVLVRGFLISTLGCLQQVIFNAILNMAFLKLSCAWSEIAIIIKTTLLDIFIFKWKCYETDYQWPFICYCYRIVTQVILYPWIRILDTERPL